MSRLKLHALPAYKIAHKAGIHPSTLSQLINGIEIIRENDPRILTVAKILGLRKDEVFEAPE